MRTLLGPRLGYAGRKAVLEFVAERKAALYSELVMAADTDALLRAQGAAREMEELESDLIEAPDEGKPGGVPT